MIMSSVFVWVCGGLVFLVSVGGGTALVQEVLGVFRGRGGYKALLWGGLGA